MSKNSMVWEPARGKFPYAVQIVYFSFICLIFFFTCITAVCIVRPSAFFPVFLSILAVTAAGILSFLFYHRGRHHTYLLWDHAIYRIRYVKRLTLPQNCQPSLPPVDISRTLKSAVSESDGIKILKIFSIKDTPRLLIVKAEVLYLGTQKVKRKKLYIKNCYPNCQELYQALRQIYHI